MMIFNGQPGSREYYAYREAVDIWMAWQRLECVELNNASARRFDRQRNVAAFAIFLVVPIVIFLLVALMMDL